MPVVDAEKRIAETKLQQQDWRKQDSIVDGDSRTIVVAAVHHRLQLEHFRFPELVEFDEVQMPWQLSLDLLESWSSWLENRPTSPADCGEWWTQPSLDLLLSSFHPIQRKRKPEWNSVHWHWHCHHFRLSADAAAGDGKLYKALRTDRIEPWTVPRMKSWQPVHWQFGRTVRQVWKIVNVSDCIKVIVNGQLTGLELAIEWSGLPGFRQLTRCWMSSRQWAELLKAWCYRLGMPGRYCWDPGSIVRMNVIDIDRTINKWLAIVYLVTQNRTRHYDLLTWDHCIGWRWVQVEVRPCRRCRSRYKTSRSSRSWRNRHGGCRLEWLSISAKSQNRMTKQQELEKSRFSPMIVFETGSFLWQFIYQLAQES